MKSNREFLDGVYSKAEDLQRDKNRERVSTNKYLRYSYVAALFVLIPVIFFANNNLGYREIPKIEKLRIFNEPTSPFTDAEFIVVGETIEVGKSEYIKEDNYIYTDIIIALDEVLLGELKDNEIVLRVFGGKVRKEKVYAPMEGDFIEGNRSVLIINKLNQVYELVNGKESQLLEIEQNVFMDRQGEEYSLEEIKNNIKIGEY